MALTILSKAAASMPSKPKTDPDQPLVMGLDMSTKTGVALLDYRTVPAGLLSLQTIHFGKVKGRDDTHSFDRWKQYEDAMIAILEEHKPTLVVIEGYGFAGHSLSILVELGTHMKRAVHRASVPWIELKPNALKKFVTGKGTAEKNLMILEMFKRFGVDAADDNQADAAGLAYAGAVLLGLPAPSLPAPHLEPLKGLKATLGG